MTCIIYSRFICTVSTCTLTYYLLQYSTGMHTGIELFIYGYMDVRMNVGVNARVMCAYERECESECVGVSV